MINIRSLLLLLLVATPCHAEVSKPVAKAGVPAGSVRLEPTAQQDLAVKYIGQSLRENHYRHLAISDSLSQRIFTHFIDNLDANRSYFVASEVENLRRQYGNKFDDELLSGKSRSGFAIYNLFLKRAREKMRFMKAMVDTVRFDFSVPDTYESDRKVSAWPADRAQLTGLWRKELKYQWLNQKYSGEQTKSIREALGKTFTSRLALLNKQNTEDAFQMYIYAVTSSFDPHTSYFSPDEYRNFQIDMSRSLEGIGAKLQTEGEYTAINEIIPGGPAFKSGQLKKSDKIIAVGQGKTGEMVDIGGLRINEVVKLIRGKKGTVVRLSIYPASQGGRGPAKIVQLVREKVDLEEQAAKKSVITQGGKKIGVITIPSFYLDFEGQQQNRPNYTSTTRDVARILGELNAEKVSGIIVDLRDNGGGSLDEAISVTGLFIPSGPVVQISTAQGEKMVLRDDDRRIFYSGPLAVLVNRYSASASEIFAAAIQDYGRGVIIGGRTFGKGTVQSIAKLTRRFPFLGENQDIGQLKLTIAKFYRISGGSTQHKGVVPDIVIPTLIDTTTVGEDTYDSSMPWSTLARSFYRQTGSVTPEALTQLRHRQQERSSKSKQYQAYVADVNMLQQMRKKKFVSLRDTEFKSEIEAIKKIEGQWVQDPDSVKVPQKDVMLNQSVSIVSDLADYVQQQQQTLIRVPQPLN